MPLSSFPNGLRNAADYLNPNNHREAPLGEIPEDLRQAVKPVFEDTSIKEVVCSLMAGRGFLLPNSQLGIYNSSTALCNLNNIQSELKESLGLLSDTYLSYMNHNSADNVLGRAGGSLSEILAISSMLNFCVTPLDPLPIDNLLEGSMESFLGGGQEINDQFGSLDFDHLGSSDYNKEVFQPELFNGGSNGGILDKIASRYSDVENGGLDQAFIEELESDIDRAIQSINELMERENNMNGIHSGGFGGSEFADPNSRPFNTKFGVLFNSEDEGIQGVTSIGSRLKSLYSSLSEYPVTAKNGTQYNNIFETFLEPDLLNLLAAQEDPTPPINERIPVYDHCGEITGYITEHTQRPVERSAGTTPQEINGPGFQAGGLSTNPLSFALARADSSSPTTVAAALPVVEGTATTEAVQTNVLWSSGAIINPSDNSAWLIQIQAVGKQRNNASVFGVRVEALISNHDGTITLAGSDAAKTIFNHNFDGDPFDLLVSIDDDGLAVFLDVLIDDAPTVDWNIRMTYQQVLDLT